MCNIATTVMTTINNYDVTSCLFKGSRLRKWLIKIFVTQSLLEEISRAIYYIILLVSLLCCDMYIHIIIIIDVF